MEFVTAFSTNDGKSYIDKHSGDSQFFDLYKISESETSFLKRIVNPPKEEKRHADPEKAKSISGLLKKEEVRVMVSKVFGPNIKRMKKKFVCIMMNDATISQSLTTLQQQLSKIQKEWESGEDRKVLNFKK